MLCWLGPVDRVPFLGRRGSSRSLVCSVALWFRYFLELLHWHRRLAMFVSVVLAFRDGYWVGGSEAFEFVDLQLFALASLHKKPKPSQSTINLKLNSATCPKPTSMSSFAQKNKNKRTGSRNS